MLFGLSSTSPTLHLPVLDLLGHGQEGLFDIGCVLGRGLEEGDAELVRKGLEIVSGDLRTRHTFAAA
jgi:hypothetical protein